MGENSAIEWTDHTFNPWIGCTKVATGCAHYYAERDMDHRYGKAKWGPAGARVKTTVAYWRKPLKWDRDAAAAAGERRRVFCASLADVFEDWQGPIMAPGKQPVILSHEGRASNGSNRLTMNDLRRELFRLIDATPHLDWLLLTKRPENIRRMWPGKSHAEHAESAETASSAPLRENVWLLTSIAAQEDADRNIPELLQCRDLVPVLGVSAEPLVGPVNLRFTSRRTMRNESPQLRFIQQLDWVIVGGESGPGARPMHPDWARALRDQCQSAGVPFFFKQWGEWYPDDHHWNGNLYHGRQIFRWTHDGPSIVSVRVGKKAAGRRLDGRLYDEFPNVIVTAIHGEPIGGQSAKAPSGFPVTGDR